MRYANSFFVIIYFAVIDGANPGVVVSSVTGPLGDNGLAIVEEGKYIPTDANSIGEAIAGIQEVLIRETNLAHEMMEAGSAISTMSVQATMAAALVQILNTELDLVQRSMIQLESIQKEEKLVIDSMTALFKVMEKIV